MLGVLRGLSRSLHCLSGHIRVEFAEYVEQTPITGFARNVFDVFLKAYFQLAARLAYVL